MDNIYKIANIYKKYETKRTKIDNLRKMRKQELINEISLVEFT